MGVTVVRDVTVTAAYPLACSQPGGGSVVFGTSLLKQLNRF